MLSTSVVGMQKMPTSRSLMARLKMNRLVTVRMFLQRSTTKHTTLLPTMHTRKMSRYEMVKTAATGGLWR